MLKYIRLSAMLYVAPDLAVCVLRFVCHLDDLLSRSALREKALRLVVVGGGAGGVEVALSMQVRAGIMFACMSEAAGVNAIAA